MDRGCGLLRREFEAPANGAHSVQVQNEGEDPHLGTAKWALEPFQMQISVVAESLTHSVKSTDCGWASLYGDRSGSLFVLQLEVDEDQFKDRERSHSRENIAFFRVFEPAASEISWDDIESGDASGRSPEMP